MTNQADAIALIEAAADDVVALDAAVASLQGDSLDGTVWEALQAILRPLLDVRATHPEHERRQALWQRVLIASAAASISLTDGRDLGGGALHLPGGQGVEAGGGSWSDAASDAASDALCEAAPEDYAEPTMAEPPEPEPTMAEPPAPQPPVTEPPTAEPPTPEPAEPVPAAAYPLIRCNPVWVSDAEEQVVIGLTPNEYASVSTTGAVLAADEAEATDLKVTLLFDPHSIRLGAGFGRVFDLPVTATTRSAEIPVAMTALPGKGLARERRIGLHFHRSGRSVGFAWRRIGVVDPPEKADGSLAPAPAPDLLDLVGLADELAPDLVLAIYRGDDADGRSFVWDAFPSSDEIAVPDSERSSGIESKGTEEFATQARRTIGGGDKTGVQLFTQLKGYGIDIGQAIPSGIVDTVREVLAHASGTAPTVLLMTEEASVPWELAVFQEPSLGTGTAESPFLGAHVAISRWPLVSGKPRPTPQATHGITAGAVLSAKYEDVANWPKLPCAEAEADRLATKYGLAAVAPLWDTVRACLEGDPAVDWLHVALHGQFDVGGDKDGLVLLAPQSADAGAPLRPEYLTVEQVQTLELAHHPFVFMNACQVGAGAEVLGSYSGMAVALLRGGAAAVVAAQWNIDDLVAGTVADRFYEQVLGADRVSVAEALRSLRAGYTEDNVKADDKAFNPTLIAYQLFGHPRLTLQR